MARTITNPEVGRYYNATGVIEITDCPNCGIFFGVPKALIERAREENSAVGKPLRIYCPLGHNMIWTGRNEEQELERKLRRQKERTQEERDRAARAVHREAQAQRREQAQRGAATRARNERDRILGRIAEGVCPVRGCGRHFKDVKAHMLRQHPDFEIPDPQ